MISLSVVGNVTYKIRGDSSKLPQDMNDANSIVEKSTSKWATAGKAAAGVFLSIGTAAVAGMGKLAAEGATFNSTIEQYQTSFEVMTGSAEKAVEITQELAEVGAKTPFEMTDLANVTQLLMNYGISADDAMDKMQMLGDIAQGDAEKMQRVATAYGQMSSAGKVSLEDIKQMIEAGFNPLQEISETTGESMTSLYDRISKGTISVDEITASMQRSTSEGGKYFQSMEKQSQTLSGRISTLKDNFSQFAGTIMEGAMPAIGGLVDGFSEMLSSNDGLADSLSKTLTTIGDGLLEVLPELLGAVEEILPVLAELAADIAPLLVDILSAIMPVLMMLIESVLPMIVELLGTLLPPIANIIDALMPLIEVILSVLIPAIQFLGETFSLVLNGVVEFLRPIIESITLIFQGLIDFINNIFSGDWEAAWESISGVFEGIWNALKYIAQAAINGVIDVVNLIIRAYNATIGEVGDFLIGWLGFSVKIGEIQHVNIVGSHKSGLDYVPYDNYIARLHKGERVLTAEENAAYTMAAAGLQISTGMTEPHLIGSTGMIIQNVLYADVEIDGVKLGRMVLRNIDDAAAFTLRGNL